VFIIDEQYSLAWVRIAQAHPAGKAGVSISSHPHRGVRRKPCVGQLKKRCKSREWQAFDLKAHRQLEILL
jgi:hypothetical protein